jgi:GNAT superfamily N-acetyltransferase
MINIRKAEKKDTKEILRLVMELAKYENAVGEVTNTEKGIEEEGFGENPAFECFLAENNDTVVGMALYYYRYSTWKGRRLYLEDLIVTESFRGKGVGKLLFEALIFKAKNENCTGMMWQVLDWNESAIDFYKKYGTRFDEGWLNCHLDF